MMLDRQEKPGKASGGSSFDWIFIWVLLAVTITGFLVGMLRYAQIQGLGYAVYFVHLVLVFDLLIYLPYSKFAHLVYRTVALVYAECSGRREAAPKPVGERAAEQKQKQEQVQASAAD
jgi:quinone-modifying oxidoreductase subunit QmoC